MQGPGKKNSIMHWKTRSDTFSNLRLAPTQFFSFWRRKKDWYLQCGTDGCQMPSGRWSWGRDAGQTGIEAETAPARLTRQWLIASLDCLNSVMLTQPLISRRTVASDVPRCKKVPHGDEGWIHWRADLARRWPAQIFRPRRRGSSQLSLSSTSSPAAFALFLTTQQQHKTNPPAGVQRATAACWQRSRFFTTSPPFRRREERWFAFPSEGTRSALRPRPSTSFTLQVALLSLIYKFINN